MSKKFNGHLSFEANTERTYNVTLFEGTDVVQSYGFTQPVYRYYEHFQDLVWDPSTAAPTRYSQKQNRKGITDSTRTSRRWGGGLGKDGMLSKGKKTKGRKEEGKGLLPLTGHYSPAPVPPPSFHEPTTVPHEVKRQRKEKESSPTDHSGCMDTFAAPAENGQQANSFSTTPRSSNHEERPNSVD
eukprot:NODE_943_length_1359_cov_65.109924_g786_i0.p2 GENE.NODE_943_length_1359_cov_65.109924_g786_i0~~NODE_943_length_1359_cov_65.109924_g786_i0.p2  ORF type:complete len:185 (+),score=29.23 NODE_943_length_1359_cov_65.109924_g786_i0:761-1315(+)